MDLTDKVVNFCSRGFHGSREDLKRARAAFRKRQTSHRASALHSGSVRSCIVRGRSVQGARDLTFNAVSEYIWACDLRIGEISGPVGIGVPVEVR